MEFDYQEGPWVETDVSLVIQKPDLDGDFVSRSIPVPPTSLRSSPTAGDQRNGGAENGLWILTIHKRLPGGVGDQLVALLDEIEPHRSGIRLLVSQGYEISIRIFGFVGRGSTFALSPGLVGRVAGLGIPLAIAPHTSDR
ncbi:hypothetical protein ACKI1I_17940 [Streptomyces turgidiscabies]|uniref:DUF4279 domain-containing protein n=1 Tax=Streptomyces turgidiscabies (strain Car8) TaxID=698760 RepID=L7FF44_STRT8|nr:MULTISPECIES: hypothetical protein [Streptomyces]ELP70003.1 hypothetical protein STRTUCAR8_07109 [Streptomyces turgidiscabies Car8]MDX3498000.1 hypothetical protein [Streptomyces turgidiscabies]GAQ69909.1 hypothetical protein T45_01640 [Streptomyces turgidiscabies]